MRKYVSVRMIFFKTLFILPLAVCSIVRRRMMDVGLKVKSKAGTAGEGKSSDYFGYLSLMAQTQ